VISRYDDLTPDALASLKFDAPEQACHILQSMAGHDVPDATYGALLSIVTDSLRDNPDPDRAIANLGRLADSSGNRLSLYALLTGYPATTRMLLTLLADSQYLAGLLIRNPEYLEVVTNPRIRDRERTAEDLWTDMTRRVTISKWPNARRDALRRFKPPEVLRIGARDLLGFAEMQQTVTDISLFADASVKMALAICADEKGIVDPPFAVIAMGKLGGRELNYSSDIDLIFVHAEREGFDPIKLAEGVRDTMARNTDAGFVFRVDLRLRPEGRFGPISRSVESCRTYYEAWAEPWERQALLKARFIAGDPAVGGAFIQLAEEFVFRNRVEASFVESIRHNKRRIEERIAHAGESATNAKEGVGAIRDVEFAVQLLQLMAGGQHPEIRTGNTLEALEKLTEASMITEDERSVLKDGYVLTRTVEHRLQLMDELPVRCIPAGGPELTKFARRLNYADAHAFLDEYRAATSQVNRIFRRLFYGETKDAAPSDQTDLGALLLAGDGADAAERLRNALAQMEFSDAKEAEALLRRHITGSEYGDITPEARTNFANIAGKLAQAAARTEDPPAALKGMELLASAAPSRAALYRSLADSPELIDRLCLLAAASSYLWQILLRHPEFFDLLADDESLEAAAERPAARAVDASATARALLRSRLALGAEDIWDLLPASEVPEKITISSEWAIDRAVQAAREELGFAGRFAVIGLGKLGGSELGYGSDLDVVYVSESDEITAATRVAERVANWLQRDLNKYGFRYEIDARLRPDGRKGNLVRDIEGYQQYYDTSAATWERHALIKARAVGGDSELGREFETMAREIVYGAPWTPEQILEVRNMKRRIETERLHDPRDIKLGPGGLTDIEWTTQMLQMFSGGKRPKLRRTATLAALRELRDDVKIKQDDWEVLSSTYVRLIQLRNRLFLKQGIASDVPVVMPDDLSEAMRNVRVICMRLFYGEQDQAKQ